MKNVVANYFAGNVMAGWMAGGVVLILLIVSGGDSMRYMGTMLFGRDYWYQKMHHEDAKAKTLKAIENHPNREKLLEANPYLGR